VRPASAARDLRHAADRRAVNHLVGVWSRLGIAGQSTLNRTLVFWSWAFGARVCWLTAGLKACVCTDGLRPGRNCYAAAASRAGNRLELEARALILLP
jgi:hypothetical protein